MSAGGEVEKKKQAKNARQNGVCVFMHVCDKLMFW